AQENAMSSKSIGEMKSILDRIVRSANITESRNFTASLQSGLVGHLREKYDQIDSLGVKKAPFYVLVGAQMPASLVEVSFLSSAPEGERLGSAAYRRTIAAGLYFGVLRYIKALGKS
ncbi:MAG TPA: N-acetylmuramoyl-L-alanine amidase, partial [Candidatus Aminicenantes bacterium]|nr:N-acetylmuramoyl-L-alanine amidase [Candidatus Aminicenantes bacterium]